MTSARLSSAGQPLLVLSNGHAYVHHGGMRSWMRVADDAFPASAFTSNLTSPTGSTRVSPRTGFFACAHGRRFQ